jgi:hypothetical protein
MVLLSVDEVLLSLDEVLLSLDEVLLSLDEVLLSLDEVLLSLDEVGRTSLLTRLRNASLCVQDGACRVSQPDGAPWMRGPRRKGLERWVEPPPHHPWQEDPTLGDDAWMLGGSFLEPLSVRDLWIRPLSTRSPFPVNQSRSPEPVWNRPPSVKET